MNEKEVRTELASLCRRLYDRHLVAGCGGNVAARFGDGMIVTPSGASLGEIGPDDLVTVDAEGRSADERKPTKEASLHRTILDMRPEATIVAHTHNPYATASSTLLEPGVESIPPMTPGFSYFAWPLPMTPFYLPGSEELVDAVKTHIGPKNAILLQNHGLIVWASDASTALMIAEEVEETAQVWLLAGGKGRAIPPDVAAKVW